MNWKVWRVHTWPPPSHGQSPWKEHCEWKDENILGSKIKAEGLESNPQLTQWSALSLLLVELVGRAYEVTVSSDENLNAKETDRCHCHLPFPLPDSCHLKKTDFKCSHKNYFWGMDFLEKQKTRLGWKLMCNSLDIVICIVKWLKGRKECFMY